MNKTTALIFFGILLVGLGISLYTLKGCGDRPGVAGGTGPSAPEGGVAPDPAPADAPGKEPSPAKSKRDPVAPEVSKGTPEASRKPLPAGAAAADQFKTPEAAMAALGDRIRARDFEGFAALAGEGAISPEILAQVELLVKDPSLQLDPAKPQVEISKSADGFRWAFNFVPAAGEGAGRQLYVDLAEKEGEQLDIARIALPLETLAEARARGPGAAPSAASGSPGAPGALPGGADHPVAAAGADALTVAHAFSKAVIRRDFKTARDLADPGSVTDERVAALMIAVEEGKFALREDRPLVVTLSRDDITWVLARIQSESMASEFAVELSRVEELWKVNGLTFSKVLSALSEAAGGGEVAYSPIVEDPAGGDSLVLYFEFDDAGLTPRTERQLAIVAEILNQAEERVIRISGHADALGSDDYNVGLSNRRAESIRQALVRRGVKPAQVVTEAYGAAKPRKPNFLPDGSDNPSGRSENRRAEVLLDF